MSLKNIPYRSNKNIMEEQFQEFIRSDFSYIEGGNLTSLQYEIEKKLDQFAPVKKIILRRNNKLHMSIEKTYQEKIILINFI